METTNELLDQVKVRYGLKSDYALAAKLGMTRSLVSAYRNNKRMLGDDAALKVAELLDLDPGYILATMEAQRTHNDAARAAWERLADFVKSHGAAAVLALLVVAPALTPTQANAAPSKAGAGVCILCKIRRLVEKARSALSRGGRCGVLSHGTATV